MKGKDLFLGLSYVNQNFIEEAETVTRFKEKAPLSPRRIVLIAATVALMLFLLGCAVKALISMRVEEVAQYSDKGQFMTGEAVHFDKTNNVFIELGAYYPQEIPEGYTMTFVSDGAPLQHQRITYEGSGELYFDYAMMLGDPASSVEVYDITEKTEVDINGCAGIHYQHAGGLQTLVWIEEEQGFGFVLRTNDPGLDLLRIARSTAPGTPLTPTRSESTVKALEELGDFSPAYLPEGYEEQGVMGSPLSEGGGWYSYVRKYYVNKVENTRIFFEYESYAIDTEMGYEDSAKTACSFYIPGCDILSGTLVGEETEIGGMYALVTGNHIAWADPESHTVFHLTSEDVLGEDLLRVAQSICETTE